MKYFPLKFLVEDTGQKAMEAAVLSVLIPQDHNWTLLALGTVLCGGDEDTHFASIALPQMIRIIFAKLKVS